MNTIIAILEPHADGTLHLPLPTGLPLGKVKVTATLESPGRVIADRSMRARRLLGAGKNFHPTVTREKS